MAEKVARQGEVLKQIQVLEKEKLELMGQEKWAEAEAINKKIGELNAIFDAPAPAGGITVAKNEEVKKEAAHAPKPEPTKVWPPAPHTRARMPCIVRARTRTL